MEQVAISSRITMTNIFGWLAVLMSMHCDTVCDFKETNIHIKIISVWCIVTLNRKWDSYRTEDIDIWPAAAPNFQFII